MRKNGNADGVSITVFFQAIGFVRVIKEESVREMSARDHAEEIAERRGGSRERQNPRVPNPILRCKVQRHDTVIHRSHLDILCSLSPSESTKYPFGRSRQAISSAKEVHNHTRRRRLARAD